MSNNNREKSTVYFPDTVSGKLKNYSVSSWENYGDSARKEIMELHRELQYHAFKMSQQ